MNPYNFLKKNLYAVIVTLLLVFLAMTSFDNHTMRFTADELTVKRINLVGEDGSLRMVLSNETRQHPGRINGKDLPPRERAQGLLFFNNEGDECGGLTYYGKTENGQTNSTFSFTADQYKQDQVFQILNSEYYDKTDTLIERGISLSDYPPGSNLGELLEEYEKINKLQDKQQKKALLGELSRKYASRNRVFMGRNGKNEAGLFLSGPDGKVKIKIFVDAKGNPQIVIVDTKGNEKNLLIK